VVVRRYTVAVLWRGDQEQRRAATPYNNRYRRVFEELMALGIDAQPAIYADDIATLVREQLLKADGVLVWVDPIHEGRTRVVLDQMLRDVATRGPWVSAHPDVILKIALRRSYIARNIWAGGRTLTFTDQWPISLRHFHEGFEHAARVSLNRTAETVARAFGELN
jgi:hypothetical protein